MRKLAFIIAFICFALVSVSSQSCLPEGITFTTQSQIDSFQINYPGCTEIEGTVIFESYEIDNLNGLNVVSSILGKLYIKRTAYPNLNGLSNLEYIGGLLVGSHNSTTQGCYINAITSLEVLENIDSIGGDVFIHCTDDLYDLSGLENVKYIDGDLILGYYDSWGEFDPLADISALSNLTAINGKLSVVLTKISNLTALENINPYSISSLELLWNINLSHCHVLSICEYLANPGGNIWIGANKQGCNSQKEIQDSCIANAVSIDEQCLRNYLTIYPNPAHNELNISVEGYTIDELNIITLTGQQALHERPLSSTIDISALQAGMYIVEVAVENKRIRQKLLVE